MTSRKTSEYKRKRRIMQGKTLGREKIACTRLTRHILISICELFNLNEMWNEHERELRLYCTRVMQRFWRCLNTRTSLNMSHISAVKFYKNLKIPLFSWLVCFPSFLQFPFLTRRALTHMLWLIVVMSHSLVNRLYDAIIRLHLLNIKIDSHLEILIFSFLRSPRTLNIILSSSLLN